MSPVVDAIGVGLEVASVGNYIQVEVNILLSDTVPSALVQPDCRCRDCPTVIGSCEIQRHPHERLISGRVVYLPRPPWPPIVVVTPRARSPRTVRACQRGFIRPDFAEAFAWRIRIHRAGVNGKTMGHRHRPSTTRNLTGIGILAAVVSYLGIDLTGCLCSGDERGILGYGSGLLRASRVVRPADGPSFEVDSWRSATRLLRRRRRTLTRRLTRRLSLR